MKPRYSINFNPYDGLKVFTRLITKNSNHTIQDQNGFIFTDSGTSSLRLFLRNLGISKGERVLIPLLTCENVARAVIAEGYQPVFADFNPDKLFSTPEDYYQAYNDYEPRIIIPVSMWGLPFDLTQLRKKLPGNETLILDCALSIGSKVNSQPDGSSAEHAIYSFGLGKPICFGAGGALKTSIPIQTPFPESALKKIFTALVRITSTTIHKGVHSKLLYGFYYHRLRKQRRIEDQSPLGQIQIYPSISDLVMGKKESLNTRNEILKTKALELGSILSNHHFKYIVPADNVEWNYWDFPILVPDTINPDKFVVEAAKRGYEFGKPYRRTVRLANAYWKHRGNCKEVERYIDRLLLFPDLASLTDHDFSNIEKLIAQSLS